MSPPKRKRVLRKRHGYGCPKADFPDLWCNCPGGPLLIETWLPVTDKRRDAVAAALAERWEALPKDAVERIAREVGL